MIARASFAATTFRWNHDLLDRGKSVRENILMTFQTVFIANGDRLDSGLHRRASIPHERIVRAHQFGDTRPVMPSPE